MSLESCIRLASDLRMTTNRSFLSKLQAEAAVQSKLQKNRWLPAELDLVTSTIGKFPWQVILILSGLTSLFIEIVSSKI